MPNAKPTAHDIEIATNHRARIIAMGKRNRNPHTIATRLRIPLPGVIVVLRQEGLYRPPKNAGKRPKPPPPQPGSLKARTRDLLTVSFDEVRRGWSS